MKRSWDGAKIYDPHYDLGPKCYVCGSFACDDTNNCDDHAFIEKMIQFGKTAPVFAVTEKYSDHYEMDQVYLAYQAAGVLCDHQED